MIKAVIFDVDGVLLDSFAANFEFFKNLLKLGGYGSFTQEQYKPVCHFTMEDTVAALINSDDTKEVERVCSFTEVAEAPSPNLNDGVAETVRALSQKYILAIVTSRIKAYMYEPPLDTLKAYFKIGVAAEDTKKHKPYPEPLLFAAEKLGLAPAECIYIGDAESDLQAARAAGMNFILYSKDGEKKADTRAAERTTDFREIPDLIKCFE